MPPRPAGDFTFGRFAWATPVAGAVVGILGALALVAASAAGLPPLVAAALAVATLTGATGALHEDGLADVADGFGGGANRERKLAIMRDSRIGSFGAVALIMTLIVRVGALSAAVAKGLPWAVGALVLASAVSRVGALAPLTFLNPARADGAGASAGRLKPQSFAAACVAALAIVVIVGFAATGVRTAFIGALCSAIGAGTMTLLANRQIGGQTGDVAGAAQQWAEVAAWCGLLIGRSAA
jgi:adenosylcobinamide-GDP ribazoletransferase